MTFQRLYAYARLMRLDRPIGIYLLLWPTLWALWIAGKGAPHLKLIFIFIAGVVLMRSAGCILNDIADRDIDGYVQRTKNRPLVSGDVTLWEAFLLFGSLSIIAFILILFTNKLVVALSFVGILITMFYPLMKRITHFPQFV